MQVFTDVGQMRNESIINCSAQFDAWAAHGLCFVSKHYSIPTRTSGHNAEGLISILRLDLGRRHDILEVERNRMR